MDPEYPVPGYPDYAISLSGDVISYRTSKRKILKPCITRITGSRSQVRYNLTDREGVVKKLKIERMIIASKLGEWPPAYIQARHKNGDPMDNSWNNVIPGCVINNILDDIENGTRETDAANIDLAIKRLEALKLSCK